MAVFLIQGGFMPGWCRVGVVSACDRLLPGAVAAFFETAVPFEIFDSAVYVITRLPSELRFEPDPVDRRASRW